MNRVTLCLFLCLGIFCQANAQSLPLIEEAYEAYHFCLYEVEDNGDDYESELLTCINSSMEAEGYETFTSLLELLDYIRDYVGDTETEESQ